MVCSQVIKQVISATQSTQMFQHLCRLLAKYEISVAACAEG